MNGWFNQLGNVSRFAAIALFSGLVILSLPAGVSAQCGSYVILLDEQGEPIIERQAMAHDSVSRSGLTYSPEESESPSHNSPTPPCSGPQCRQGGQPLSVPPTLPDRITDSDAAYLIDSSADHISDPSMFPRTTDRYPSEVIRGVLERPPETL